MLMKIKFFESNQNDNRPDDKKISIFPKGEENMKHKNASLSLEEKLKGIIQKRRDEQAKIEKIPREETYNRMVKEAFLVISDLWEMEAKLNKNIDPGTELTANAFFIAESTLQLYTDAIGVRNPETGKSCFYDTFVFESMEEFEKYVEDVKKLLPAGTEVLKREYTTYNGDGAKVHVIFKLKIE